MVVEENEIDISIRGLIPTRFGVRMSYNGVKTAPSSDTKPYRRRLSSSTLHSIYLGRNRTLVCLNGTYSYTDKCLGHDAIAEPW